MKLTMPLLALVVAILLVPLAAHALFARPLVLGRSSEAAIEMTIDNRDDGVLTLADVVAVVVVAATTPVVIATAIVATASAVMSSCVGPIPPEVKTMSQAPPRLRSSAFSAATLSSLVWL